MSSVMSTHAIPLHIFGMNFDLELTGNITFCVSFIFLGVCSMYRDYKKTSKSDSADILINGIFLF